MNKKRLITILAIYGGLIIIGIASFTGYKTYVSYKEEQSLLTENLKREEDLARAKLKAKEEKKKLEEENIKLKEELENKKKNEESAKQKAAIEKKQIEEKTKQQKTNTPSKIYGCSIIDDTAESVRNLTLITGSLIESIKNVSMTRDNYSKRSCDFNTLATTVKDEFKTVCRNIDAIDDGRFLNGKSITIPRSQIQTFKNIYLIADQVASQLDDMFHTENCELPPSLMASQDKLAAIQQSNIALCNKYGVTNLAG